MNLSDYISLTLSEIAEGVRKANETYDEKGGGTVPTTTRMEIEGIPCATITTRSGAIKKPIVNVGFRVGVEVEETKEKGGKLDASLKVITLGAGISKKDGAKSIHEITFELPLILSED